MVAGRPLRALAWVNVVLHVLGLGLAAFGMRPGSPLVPLDRRIHYLAGAPVGWTAGWAVWMLCAGALVTYLAYLSHLLGGQARLARLGLTVAVVGAGFDLYCDATYLLVLPALASRQPVNETVFLTLERITGIGSLLIANGAYSLATLLVNTDLRGRQGFGRGVTGVGYAVAGFGLVLSAAGLTGDPWHAAVATVPTIGLFCVWVVLVARSAEPRRGP